MKITYYLGHFLLILLAIFLLLPAFEKAGLGPIEMATLWVLEQCLFFYFLKNNWLQSIGYGLVSSLATALFAVYILWPVFWVVQPKHGFTTTFEQLDQALFWSFSFLPLILSELFIQLDKGTENLSKN